MPKTPKEKPAPDDDAPKVKNQSTPSEGEAERSYYYDDAYGYEEYRDDKDVPDDNEPN